jgi:hypothetical protein
MLRVDASIIRVDQLSYRNPNNHGTLATPSETSCKEAFASPPELRNVSRRDGSTTRCSRSDPLYEHFQVRTRQELTAARYPARLRPPRQNSVEQIIDDELELTI